MKKVILLLVLGLAVTFVNAQDTTKSTKKTTTKTNATTDKSIKTPVKTADLLKAITDDLATNYKDYTVTSAFKVIKGDVTKYSVNVEKGTSKFRLFYDADGKFLNKVDSVKPTTTTKTNTTK
jgi:hypothetical protein